MSWSFRCKNIPKAVCDISDTKIHSIAKWFGYALDQIEQQSDEVEILVIDHLYRLSSKTNTFQTKLATQSLKSYSTLSHDLADIHSVPSL
eukprot:scaffold163609_cov26-Attheya_sp.AAC.1